VASIIWRQTQAAVGVGGHGEVKQATAVVADQEEDARVRRRGPELATEGDLELLAEEQVLEEEALTAAEDAGEGAQEEPEDFDTGVDSCHSWLL
jgi:hypothetical protein